ncbi:STAS domain-containing protein [Streptomyces neyagawaensis]|uniref:STAS domain-containing protein n=1 Tax=Streptomyces neyagawaensis TaxID=42238 RepID=UPI0006E1D4ED|nr:STAS domain-containing protein [Streptomyces neyagawaensis]MCL6732488.1 STAS domain-containing protein [Streptomyces neyagawaensis]MDE1687126.1 STAS domain-containing protein [Streptomyces neyagawaensis]
MPEQETAAHRRTPAQEVAGFLRDRQEQIAQRWADAALFRTVFTHSRDEAVEAGRAVVDALAAVATAEAVEDAESGGFHVVRDQLARTAASRARAGSSITDISREVDALRPPVTELFLAEFPDAPAEHVRECTTTLTVLMGTLRLVVLETALSEGEEVIHRQRLQLLEVATPVIKLWEGIVAVPLIGTLDSARSQVVMETLLDSIVEQHARFAILDITGVPTVDSLVAQHLMKTVAAARLMGAECIVSGIRPPIAQTIVHLGIDLSSVLTRASLADALAYALRQQGADIVAREGAGSEYR